MRINEISAAQQQVLQHKDLTEQRHLVATKDATNRDAAGKRPTPDDSVRLRTDTTSHALRKVDAKNSVMNAAANSIRTADEAMQRIGKKIDGMNRALTGIVKQYPPFPPGSEARIALLKSFSALRQEIDELTFPPDDTGAQHILSAAGKDGEESSTVDLGDGRLDVSVHRLPVTAGPEGLDIPDLSMDADDDQIRQTLAHVDQAKVNLDTKRDLLAADAKRIIQLQ